MFDGAQRFGTCGGVLFKKVTLAFILLFEEAQPKFNIDLVTAFSPDFHTWTKTKTNMCG